MSATTAPHRIVFANEKGGTGKSTTAVHIAIALAYQGHRVAAIDLDPRQRTFHRYLENRAETMKRRDVVLPTVRFAVFGGDTTEELDKLKKEVAPLVYAELIWETRKKRAMSTIRDQRREMDWVVVRNRTQHVEARNMRRLDNALAELSKRVGFRVAQGLSERVIYRELFPSGLTLLDKGHLGELGTSHLVARQELRQLVAGLNLPLPVRAGAPAALSHEDA